ncbi:hypothetical protein ETB97_009650 [Aspergillus alliaceus]|uniref:Uncharacterized protein n=1 Tax=Petromyces alliaceus TaxID=209559 RepID=A0A8H6E1H4_PETAA|nr:hypothetical protein ETB97_009650 [Aspergillus burnettii]
MARLNSPPDGPLEAALRESTTAAAIRAAEGQKIFSPRYFNAYISGTSPALAPFSCVPPFHIPSGLALSTYATATQTSPTRAAAIAADIPRNSNRGEKLDPCSKATA